MSELSVYDNDPTIYLFTSLTAGSSHIITATSRIETILKANKIPFKGVDTATDELAKKLFQRRASGKKLPLIVKEGYVLGVCANGSTWLGTSALTFRVGHHRNRRMERIRRDQRGTGRHLCLYPLSRQTRSAAHGSYRSSAHIFVQESSRYKRRGSFNA